MSAHEDDQDKYGYAAQVAATQRMQEFAAWQSRKSRREERLSNLLFHLYNVQPQVMYDEQSGEMSLTITWHVDAEMEDFFRF